MQPCSSVSQLCGFKWANTHNKCVHDPMQRDNSSTKTSLMWLHYIWYRIKIGYQMLMWSLHPL